MLRFLSYFQDLVLSRFLLYFQDLVLRFLLYFQDLVLRFLKRAAVNLSQPFKVVVPSRRLPVNDRRRILAKQVSETIIIIFKRIIYSRGRKYWQENLAFPHFKKLQ